MFMAQYLPEKRKWAVKLSFVAYISVYAGIAAATSA
jgi:hypothetical protein